MARLRSVVRSRDHEDMVQRLSATSVDGTPTVFKTIRELLCFAAMLGFQMGKSSPPSVRGEDVLIEEFNRNNSVDYIYLIAVAHTGDTEILKAESDIDMISIFEEYINGGLSVINGWLVQYRDEQGFGAILQGLKENGFIKDDIADLQTIIDNMF